MTQGDHGGRSVIISWLTPLERHPNTVTYWAAEGKHRHKHKTHATTTYYRYYNYTSGYIHHATIKRLEVMVISQWSCTFSHLSPIQIQTDTYPGN